MTVVIYEIEKQLTENAHTSKKVRPQTRDPNQKPEPIS